MKQLALKKSETFKSSSDERGSLAAFNAFDEFLTKRAFLVTCKKGNWRGKHYHKETTQVIFVISGEIEVKVTDVSGDVVTGTMTSGTYLTHSPYTQFEFCSSTEESQLLVLCNTVYDPTDYYVL